MEVILARNVNDAWDIPGVYGIFNTKTGYVYVGSSNNISGRLCWHSRFLSNTSSIGSSVALKTAWDSDGEKCFVFAVLEKTSSVKTKRLKREQYWMDLFPLRYNRCPRSDSTRGLQFTEESKKKISEITKKQHANGNLGVKTWTSDSWKKHTASFTPERRREISERTREMNREGKVGPASWKNGRGTNSEKMKKLWQDPTYRQKMRVAQEMGWARFTLEERRNKTQKRRSL